MGRKYAVVCASNMNRSMEAHFVLNEHFDVSSYGTSSQVKLPGPAKDKPNVYEFGTPYSRILHELEKQDRRLYTQNGVLNMLQRNVRVKSAPQRWHLEGMTKPGGFDVIIAFEDRVYDAIVNDFMQRGSRKFNTVRVINIATKDTHSAAEVAGKQTHFLCSKIDKLPPDMWEERFEEAIQSFEKQFKKRIVYSLQFY